MTSQIHERLIFDGEETSMAFCPPLPWEFLKDAEAKNDIETDSPIYSTACWRGYQGTWEIKEGRFYLVDVQGAYRLDEEPPLLADWFSGILRIPKGKVILGVNMGFGRVYEQETHVKIEQGLVKGTRLVDNRGKQHNKDTLAGRNLPGGENRFPGDDDPWLEANADD